jgi:RNA methyltransferase, TrmH family
MNELITSTSNPLVKRARALRQRRTRDETRLFLAEGIHPVGEAFEAGWEVEAVLYSPELLISSYANDLLARQGALIHPVSARVFESISEKDNPQGILAIVHERQAGLADLLPLRAAVAMITPQDAGNVGTVLRTVEAVGADGLILVDGGADAYHPTAVRASMGAIFWKPVAPTSFRELIEWSQQAGAQVIGTSAHADLDFQQFEPRRPWVLVMGGEQKGLSGEQLDACDAAVSLPMRGHASSLNVSVAAGILLYQFIKPE